MKVNGILAGCALFKNRDVALFAVEPQSQIGKSIFHVLLDQKWQAYQTEPEWPTAGMACALYAGAADWVIVAASSEGQTWELIPGSRAEHSQTIVGDYSGIVRLAGFHSAVWACGMDRLVLRREIDGTWSDLSAPPGEISEGVIGFNDLAGTQGGIVVAVGWRGEIWLREKGTWEAQDTGTNQNLNAVSVNADDCMVAVGDNGTIVTGRRGQWTVLDSGSEFNLQGVCHFGGEVFVCTDFELFRLVDRTLVAETRFANEDRPANCMNIFAGRHVAYSQGEQDIFRFADGMWSRVF